MSDSSNFDSILDDYLGIGADDPLAFDSGTTATATSTSGGGAASADPKPAKSAHPKRRIIPDATSVLDVDDGEGQIGSISSEFPVDRRAPGKGHGRNARATSGTGSSAGDSASALSTSSNSASQSSASVSNKGGEDDDDDDDSDDGRDHRRRHSDDDSDQDFNARSGVSGSRRQLDKLVKKKKKLMEKQKRKSAAKSSGSGDSPAADSDSDDGGSRSSKASKKGSTSKKNKRKGSNDSEDEEGNKEEMTEPVYGTSDLDILRQMVAKKKPKKVKVNMDELDQKRESEVKEFMDQLNQAIEEDEILFRNNKPAVKRLMIMPKLREMCQRIFYHKALLANGILISMRRCLEPFHDGTHPSIDVVDSIVKALGYFGVGEPDETAEDSTEDQNITRDSLIDSKVGHRLLRIAKSRKREYDYIPLTIRQAADRLLSKWQQMLQASASLEHGESNVRKEAAPPVARTNESAARALASSAASSGSSSGGVRTLSTRDGSFLPSARERASSSGLSFNSSNRADQGTEDDSMFQKATPRYHMVIAPASEVIVNDHESSKKGASSLDSMLKKVRKNLKSR